ncbi:MAG: methionyl aminopeptidase [Candidatus Marinamargulisbacteria bacterium]|jgi:methionyl aminopeptidase
MVIKKTPEEIEIMRTGGKILAEVFRVLEPEVKEGVNADYLDKLAESTIRKHGAEPSFLGYRGFKHSTCISKNEEVVHGIPFPDKILYPGDIVSVDCGVYQQGFHVDAARTFRVGSVDKKVDDLVSVTQESFFEAIKEANPGNKLGAISNALQKYVEARGYSVVRDLYSHGIGRELHEDPLIPNYGSRKAGIELEVGMTFAIEPMVNIGVYDVLTLPDKWTIITRDKKWSAHYENTICIGEAGAEVLTI